MINLEKEIREQPSVLASLKENVEKMLKDAKSNSEWGSGGLIRHKIRQGETLGGIARKYRVSVNNLKKWNNLKNSNIRAGRYLKIYK